MKVLLTFGGPCVGTIQFNITFTLFPCITWSDLQKKNESSVLPQIVCSLECVLLVMSHWLDTHSFTVIFPSVL